MHIKSPDTHICKKKSSMGQSTSLPAPSSSSNDEAAAAAIFLTPSQSCTIHGWTNPKRTLTWKDIVSSSRNIQLDDCIRSGISVEDLHNLQPDVHKWIEAGKVSLCDVPSMASTWKLHPITHLRGDISDLATMRYRPDVLEKLGINYSYMRKELLMDDDWMKMLKYRPFEWNKYLGFTREDADAMGDVRIFKVFGMDTVMLKLAMTSHD